MMPFHGCETALGFGFGAHLIFDAFSYLLVMAFGVRIGCHRHKHHHG